MGRPRKDGKPSQKPLQGKWRRRADGTRWRLVGYHPTPSAPRGRLSQINLDTGRPTSEVIPKDTTLQTYFDQREAYWDQVETGTVPDLTDQKSQAAHAGCVPNLAMLGDHYIERLVKMSRDDGHVANRRSIVNKWIKKNVGHVPVADWTVEHSLRVLQKAAASTGEANVAAVRSVLKQMRDLAWRRINGQRWLSPTVDPLEDIGYQLRSRIQAADVKYVEPHLRPSESSVASVIAVAAAIGRWSWQPLCYRLAGHCGPRLAEQLALRVIDIDLNAREIDINGRWKVTRGKARVLPAHADG